MGSWNELCLLSNLPIYEGEQVYAQLIAKNKKGSFNFIGFPMCGQLDGYGQLVQQNQLQSFVDSFALLNTGVSDHRKYRQLHITTSKSLFNKDDTLISKYWTALLREELVYNSGLEKSILDIIYYKESVFEELVVENSLHFDTLINKWFDVAIKVGYENVYLTNKNKGTFEEAVDYFLEMNSIPDFFHEKFCSGYYKSLIRYFVNEKKLGTVMITSNLALLFQLSRVYAHLNKTLENNKMRGGQFETSPYVEILHNCIGNELHKERITNMFGTPSSFKISYFPELKRFTNDD